MALGKLNKLSLILLLISAGLLSCSTVNKENASKAPSTESSRPLTVVHIKCINKGFTEKSNLNEFENNFVIIPYRNLKTPGTKQKEEDTDETENLYFDRISKMAAKVLIDAGLHRGKSVDKSTLVIGLGWNTKKSKLGWKEVDAFASNGKGQLNIEKLQGDGVYLSHLRMKAVGPDKKSARWEIEMESVNSDTFYLNVLPALFASGKDYFGKSCNSVIEKSIPNDSPEINAIRNP